MKSIKKIMNGLAVAMLIISFFTSIQVVKADMINENTTTAINVATVTVEAPKNFTIKRKSNTSLKLKWKKVKDADGYIIYRYDKKKKEYVKVKKIKKNTTTKWVNKKLKTNKIYKYKIAAYKKVKEKTLYSKKSYWVKSKTYKRNERKINGGKINVDKHLKLGIGMQGTIDYYVMPSKYGTNKDSISISQKIRWSSSDEQVATVSKDGVVTAGKKTGECYIYAMSHNGNVTKTKIKVKNYAIQKEFYYDSGYKYVPRLLERYKDEVCNIASYYTINRLGKGEKIRISLDKHADIVVSPESAIIDDSILEDVKNLLVNFPSDIEIELSEGFVGFRMYFSVIDHSCYEAVDYYTDIDCSEFSSLDNPHWDAWRFTPD